MTDVASGQAGALALTVERAILAHGEWRRRLSITASTGVSDLTSAEAADDTACDFGRWMAGDIPWRLRKTWDFATVRKRHQEFHAECARVIVLATDGQMAAASNALDHGTGFDLSAERLDAALREWYPRIEQQAAGTKA
jgi:hypothetical protein